MIKFRYKLSWLMLVNIFVEVLTVVFLGKTLTTQIPTLTDFWGRSVNVITVMPGDQVNSLIAILIVFFLAQILIGLVSLHLCRKKVSNFEFQLPAFLDFLNIKLFNLSLADGLVVWLVMQSWTFILIAFGLVTVASGLAIVANFLFIAFIVGTLVVNLGTHRKLS